MLSDQDPTRKLKLTFPVQIPHSLWAQDMIKCRGGGGVLKFQTLNTKKHQQSVAVAKPRLLFASLPSTMHCLLYF